MKTEEIILIAVVVVLGLFFLGGFGGMMGWGIGGGMMSGVFGGMWVFGWLFMILIMVALVLFIIWLVKQLQGEQDRGRNLQRAEKRRRK